MTIIASARLRAIAPYSQSRYHDEPRLDDGKEAWDAHEERTWRERCHVTDDGYIFIPPMAFKRSLESAASFLGMKIKGRRQATYSKHFKAGILVTQGLVLPIKKDEVEGETFWMNADGKRGSGTRVKRRYPVIRDWSGTVEFWILDSTIDEQVFQKHLTEAGNFIGIGRFRPEVGGFYGRFAVDKIEFRKAD